MVALSGPSDLQAHMLQLKRGGCNERGQRIRRFAGGYPRGCSRGGQGNQVARQHLGHDGAVVVAPVLLKGSPIVRQRLLAAAASAATGAARLHAATAAATLWSRPGALQGMASRRGRRSARTRLAPTQPNRNQAGDEQSNGSPKRCHDRHPQDSFRHTMPSTTVILQQGGALGKKIFFLVDGRRGLLGLTWNRLVL